MNKKQTRPEVDDFDSRMHEVRKIVLNEIEPYLFPLANVFPSVPIVELEGIEISKVKSVCMDTHTCVFVSVDNESFFQVFFEPDETIIQVKKAYHMMLEQFFKSIQEKIGAKISITDESEVEDIKESVQPDLPTEFSKNVETNGVISKSSVSVIDVKTSKSERPETFNKAINVIWDNHSFYEQIKRYLRYVFGYSDKPIASKISSIGFRNDSTITCILSPEIDPIEGDGVRYLLDTFFNDDDTPISDLSGDLWRISVTTSSGDYYNDFGLSNNGLNRYLLNNLKPEESSFIQHSLK